KVVGSNPTPATNSPQNHKYKRTGRTIRGADARHAAQPPPTIRPKPAGRRPQSQTSQTKQTNARLARAFLRLQIATLRPATEWSSSRDWSLDVFCYAAGRGLSNRRRRKARELMSLAA
ncbi:hypothetical protein, partial [Aminobacter sp. HY435]|uniref:hypothetical protein n=1 Tax=Aminobacter sp. HY435 TaxID=2970917 RepID=UPI0022B9642F